MNSRDFVLFILKRDNFLSKKLSCVQKLNDAIQKTCVAKVR